MENVPPNVANAEAQVCLNRVVDVADPPNLRVARAAERLALAERLYHTGSITEAEYGEHEKFHGKCVGAATGVFAVDGAPAWFGPAVAAAVGPAVAAAVGPAVAAAVGPAVAAAVNAELARVLARLDNIEARHRNTIAEKDDPFQVIRNGDGHVSRYFPQDMRALVAMEGRAMASFLRHYGEPIPESDHDKRQKIRVLIGVRHILL